MLRMSQCANCHESAVLTEVKTDHGVEMWCAFCSVNGTVGCAMCSRLLDERSAVLVGYHGNRDYVCITELAGYGSFLLRSANA